MNVFVETLNAAGRAFVDFALPMLIQSAVLIAALLLLDFVLRRRVRAVFRYLIWMLVLVKLVLPPSLGSPISVGTWLGDELEAPTAALLEPVPEPPPPIAHVLSGPPIGFAEPYVPVPGSVVPSPPAPSAVPESEAPLAVRSAPAANPATVTLSWQGLMLLGWATVVVALLLLLFQRALFVRDLVAQAEEAPAPMRATLDDCRARTGVRGRVTLKTSANASSPAVCGLSHPKILIPRTLAPKLSGRDLQAVLLHELAHVKRGDLWINLVQTLLQIIYFYNPLLWLANMAIRRVREQAVDEAVLVAMGERAREYPDTLIHVARLAFRRRPALSLRLVGVVESKNALTGRIKHILGRPLPKSTRLGLLSLLIIVIVAAVVLPMAKARPMTDRARKIVELAEGEARALNHSYVGTEHILIALARDSDAVSAKALANLDVNIHTLRAETKKRVKPSSDAPQPGKLPHTFRVGGTFESARREAKALGHDYIGTEHLLLGLMRARQGVGAQVLDNLGLTRRLVRDEIVRLVQSTHEAGAEVDRSVERKASPDSRIPGPVSPPIFGHDVELNFADPTVRDRSFHSEQSVAFVMAFHEFTDLKPGVLFGGVLIGQTKHSLILEGDRITIQHGGMGSEIGSETWPGDQRQFDKVITLPVTYGPKEYSCPVHVEITRHEGGSLTGSYWFCAYLSGRLPWGAGGRSFEIVNLDQQMEFRLVGDGTDKRDAVLGIDIDGDGKIDPSETGGEQLDLYEPFQISSRTYRVTEVDPYLPRVVFRDAGPAQRSASGPEVAEARSAVPGGRTEQPDLDGDGLSDFQERHKYLTDPAKRDSDGDGTPDGDWAERREYTYSVRTVLRFMPPLDEEALCDDFQDARVLRQTDDYVEIEAIHYPLATTYESVGENPNWRRDYAHLTEYLAPGATTNWDERMRRDLLAELKADGIDVDKLTDKEVVERVSRWLLSKSRSLDKVFTTFYVHCPNGRPEVYPGLEDAYQREFERDKDNYDWTIEDHLDREVLGKGMFYNKTHGSCTSTAVYLTTVLRALGIPTRMVLVSPAVDASNRKQILMVKNGLTHNRVRETILAGLRRSSRGFTNHTLNEVYVGNRWVRLDYSTLGPAIYGVHRFGLQTHLYTINDLGDVDLASTWGWRYAKGQRSDTFGHSNPYSAVSVSDMFGAHSHIPNPPFAAEDLASSPLPDIFVLYPRAVDVWDDVMAIVEDGTYNKTGRPHEREFYENTFEGVWPRKPGDVLLLVFSLDTEDRVPEGYEFVLPQPWPQIESCLKKGETVELGGDARDMKVILLAAPTRGQVIPLIQSSKLLAALNPFPTTKPERLAEERHACPVVTFRGGVTVRLLGVSEHPSEGKQWWRPDGSPIETAPYRTTGHRIKHHEGRRDYEFALRLSGPAGTKVKWLVPGSTQGSDTGQAFGKGHNHLADVYAYTANQHESVETSNVLVGVSSGPWETRAVHRDVSHEDTYGLRDKDGSAVAFGVAYARDGSTHVPVTTNFRSDRMDYRIVAVDEQGESHRGGTSGSGGNFLTSLTCMFDVPLSRVKELRFQTRPRFWVTFGNVSLRPGRKTSVQISMAATADRSAGGGAPAGPETARERPAADSTGVVAELPNGGTVELLGACRHPRAGKPWWRPDGSPLEEAPYDRPGALVTADEPNTVAYELALRVRDLPDGWDAAMWSVGTRISGAANPPYKGGRRLHDLRWLMIQVDPDQMSCTIRCDIAAPWQTIARSSPEIDVAQQPAKGRVVFSEIREGPGRGVRVTVTGSVSDRDHHPYFRDRGHHRVVALTKDGRMVESSSGGLPFFDMVGSAGAYFPRLSLADVNEFQFQIRPVSWVDFGNVSLRPGRRTEVNVELGQGRREGTETTGRGGAGISDSLRLYLPDLETPDADVVLDLATGQLLPGEPLSRDRRHFEKLGRGDVAYEHARNRGGLLCLRGARLHRRTETGLEPLTPDVTRDSFVVYFIESVPAQFQVTTAEGRVYQFNVVAKDRRGDRGGIVVEIRPTTDRDAPAEPETPTATDTSETAGVVAELPNGVTVELLALWTGVKPEERIWWRPDGSPVPQEKIETFDAAAEHPGWTNPEWEFEYGYLVTFDPWGDISVNSEVTAGNTMSFRYPRDGRISAALVASDKRDREAGLPDTGDIHVAAAYGPTENVTWRPNFEEPDQVWLEDPPRPIFLSALRPDRYQPDRGFMVDVIHNSPDLDIKLSHASADGRVWNSWADVTGGEPSFVSPRRDPRAMRYTTFRLHNVDRQSLEHIIVKYRPFHGVKFRDVALRPGVRSVVQAEPLQFETLDGGAGGGAPVEPGADEVESAGSTTAALRRLALAIVMFAQEHDGELAPTLAELKPYVSDPGLFTWAGENVVYIGGRVTDKSPPQAVATAYEKRPQTNGARYVCFLDGHVELVTPRRQKELGVLGPAAISARLQLRVAPHRHEVPEAVVERSEEALVEGRPPPDDDYVWFEVRPGTRLSPALIVREHAGKSYLLLRRGEAHVMRAGEGWGVKSVQETTDAMGRPAIRLFFDAPGAERLYALTRANVNKALAMLVDGRVVSAPEVGTPVRHAIIAGTFTEQEVQQMVEILRMGLAAQSGRQPPTAPAPGGDAGSGEPTGTRISGRVLGPDGTPVAGAQVALCSEKITVTIRDGRLDQPRTSDTEKGQIVETNARGRFRFESEPNDGFSLVAAHDAGFALVRADEFMANREIRLERWGRVEGQLAEGHKARGDQIWMGGLPNETWLKHRRRFRYETRCDAEGRFTFSKVPAGWFEVGYLTEVGDFTWSHTSRTPVVVKSGQTATVRLGGEGRPVIGRFVPPADYDGPVYFGAGTRALDTLWPERPTPDNYDQMTRRQQQEWLKQWHETPEADEYRDLVWHDLSRRHYAFRINEDGTFRIEDVIPGQYKLTVWLEERHSGQGRPEEFGSYYGTVEVPPMAEAYDDEPLDLGDLELKLRQPLHVGDAVPPFEVQTLDGRDIRLTDYRGRFVLLSLWAPVFHPDLDRLKELYADYEDTGRLLIIGFGGTDTLDEVKSYVEEHEIPWPQVYLGPDWSSELFAKLGGQLQTLLVDPEGKIVATWLRGEELTDTVRTALGKSSDADSADSSSVRLGPGRGRASSGVTHATEVGDGASLSGVVVDEAGRPLKGVTVSNWYGHGSMPQKTATDSQGRFSFAEKRGYVVKAERAGLAQEFCEFKDRYFGEWKDKAIHVTLTMTEGCAVAGSILSKGDGAPIRGAEVWLELEAEDTSVGNNKYVVWRRRPKRTDENGRFEFKRVPDGTLRVGADANGFIEGTTEYFHVADKSIGQAELALRPKTAQELQQDRILEQARRDLSLSGIVTDETGWPLEGVEISNYFPCGSNPQKTYTDADGRYRFAVHRGYVIVATKGGFAPVFHEFRSEYLAKYQLRGNWRTGPDRRGPIVVNLTLRSGVTVTGTVRSTQGGEPAAGARVHLERRAGDTDVGLNEYTIWQSDAARTDDRGRFAFEHVPSGIVWVFADGVREETLAVKEDAGGKIVCDITTSGDRARQTPAQPARPG